MNSGWIVPARSGRTGSVWTAFTSHPRWRDFCGLLVWPRGTREPVPRPILSCPDLIHACPVEDFRVQMKGKPQLPLSSRSPPDQVRGVHPGAARAALDGPRILGSSPRMTIKGEYLLY